MQAEKYNPIELMALYCAKRSVGKSIPLLVYKVPKPDNLAMMIRELTQEK